MCRIEYPNLCTIYDGQANGRQFNRSFRKSLCYGSSLEGLNKIANDANYSIILIRDTSYLLRGDNNYCWMKNKHQLENYLRRIASIKPFRYKVMEKEFSKKPCYQIDLSIHGTRKEITFVLQCIKRCYEWPYNFYLLQAYEMQALPAFKFDSILNLYNVAASTYTASSYSDHSFSLNTRFEKYADLREKLPHIEHVTDLYPNTSMQTKRPPKQKGISYCENRPNETKQWTQKFFRTMLPYYIENYNALKR